MGKVFKWASLAGLLITQRSQTQSCVSTAYTKGWTSRLKPRLHCNPFSSTASEGWHTNRLKKLRKTDDVLVNIQMPTACCYQADIYLWPRQFLLLIRESRLHWNQRLFLFLLGIHKNTRRSLSLKSYEQKVCRRHRVSVSGRAWRMNSFKKSKFSSPA